MIGSDGGRHAACAHDRCPCEDNQASETGEFHVGTAGWAMEPELTNTDTDEDAAHMSFDSLPDDLKPANVDTTHAEAIMAEFGLAMIAYAALGTLFAQWGHQPSPDQWAAIRDLLEHLEKTAEGNVEEAVYVSAIPAGTGKSASLAAFAEALMDSPRHNDVGMLIAVNRVAEAFDMAKALLPYRAKLCVIVGSERAHIADGESTIDVRTMGAYSEANEAQVVVTTQAALKASLKGASSFDEVHRYYYRGRRRAVVCWDEAIAFNRPVVLDGDNIASLTKAIRRQSSNAAVALLEWAAGLARVNTGDCLVPDFAALGVDFMRLEDDVGEADDLVAQAKALAVVSGAKGWVVREDNNAPAMVSYQPELPASLMPITVTDASAARGVHHASYEQMARTRRVVYLREAPKTYRNLTIRIVPTAASRSVYRDQKTTRGLELIEMAARYIRSVAPDDVLVVSYKSWMPIRGVAERTIAAAINARMSDDEWRRVGHLTWGTHTATNKFTRVRHVLLMGLNFVPRTASYAASGAALERSMQTPHPSDHPTEQDVTDMRLGMLRDSTLQAIMRGNARMGVGDDCGVMEVVIPQTRQTGLADDDYRGMFPGAVIVRDTTLMPAKPLRGRLKRMAEVVAEKIAAGETEITNPSIYETLAIDRRDFAKLVKKPEWQDWIAAIGLAPQPLKGNVMGLRVVG